MSVIIEGLTLPKHNPKEIDKNVLIGYAIVKEDNTAELCLEGVRYLIKMLPTPHGRLIDADKLLKDIDTMRRHKCKTCSSIIDTKHCNRSGCWMIFISDFISSLPAVVEAEVSDNACESKGVFYRPK